MTHEETLYLYQPGDRVWMFDEGEKCYGTVVAVPSEGGRITIKWDDLHDDCVHLDDEFKKIHNESLKHRWKVDGIQFNRETYKHWLSELCLQKWQVERIQKELERLIKTESNRQSQDYFCGRSDAFNAVWKLFEGTYNETDYCP